MKDIVYDKLVRDYIPEIIRKNGKEPVTDTADKAEILVLLDRKLKEETQEYIESHSIEEMADILEVLHGIAYHMGVSWDEVENTRIKKRDERGGFETGVKLIKVRDN